ncbi:flagellar basal body L-ring protein FlgH [Vulgatibacter incomptus]|uniref:Flagellar L-ring protein n=1 Tax=Vulgatibacter incomptus TaxID=1391653 RepID=A0A0K1PHW9_9BACT|nr:flagellar basal body L-ring protein FlgH [Vulgatibacter incomptus]AKU93001.1 Flagellar L-ring protein FlgH [Vulgatibacter incomptus]
MIRPIVGFTALVILAGCGPRHISTYVPKQREYQLPSEGEAAAEARTPGSLWRENRPAANLFTDARALRTNDLLVVKIEEIADAKRSADTDLTRSSQAQASISAFLGLIEKMQRNSDFRANVEGMSASSFRGEGATARTERLKATVPAIVRKVLPNGNLFIEGHRVVLVNEEEQHFYISGVVRPIDIDQENSVKSTMVADAEIEFTGNGVLTDNQRQGWLSRYLGWVWPF